MLSPSVRKTATLQQALIVLVVERVLDGLTLFAVGLIVIPPFLRATGRRGFMDGLRGPGEDSVVAALAIAGVLLLAVLLAVRVGGAVRAFIVARLHLLRDDMLLVFQHPPRRLALMAGATLIAWAGTFLLHYAVLLAFDPPEARVHPLMLAVVVTLATNLSLLAPATPAGIGLFHAAAAAPLMLVGFSRELAVAYALLLHVMNTVPPMVVGAVGLGAPLLSSRVRRALGRAEG